MITVYEEDYGLCMQTWKIRIGVGCVQTELFLFPLTRFSANFYWHIKPPKLDHEYHNFTLRWNIRVKNRLCLCNEVKLFSRNGRDINACIRLRNNYTKERPWSVHTRYLKNNKACGIDGIINEFVKNASDTILQIIVSIFNLVLDTGIVPSD